jgi:SAM-dependent methyltransferase
MSIDSIQPRDRSGASGDYRTSRDYWSRPANLDPQLAGVAAIGGAGMAEILYRHHEELRHLKRIARFDKNTAVLELGCGNGRWVESLAPLVDRYVAVDFSEGMLALSRERVRRSGLTNVTFHAAAVQEYVPDRSFDVIYLSGVSQYLHDAELEQLLGRMTSHLSADGVVVDRSTIHRRRRELSSQPGYFCIYRTADELLKTFACAGLENVYHGESYRFLNFPEPVQRMLRRPATARLVAATAGVSHAALRMGAAISRRIAGDVGELVEYSHDFLAFRRRAITG